MAASGKRSCPHYESMAEPLEIGESPAYISVRRCMLTERMIVDLKSDPNGLAMAEKLTILGTNGVEYAFIGPDLNAVTPDTCNVDRCLNRCSVGYRQTLTRFGLTEPDEDKVSCHEKATDTKF